MSCALLFSTRITGSGACIMLSPREDRRDAEPDAAQWLSRLAQQSQAPRANLVEKTVKIRGVVRQPHHVASHSSFPGLCPK